MSHKAGAALRVTDLDSTLAFYTHYLDFALVSSQPDAGTALIRDSGGDLLLLADPRIEEVIGLLAEPRLVFKPGNTLDYLETDLESRHARLLERGLTEAEILQTTSPLGDRRLTITDPNGYRFTFEQAASRTPEQTLALYSRCSDSIVEAIAGLSEADLDLKRAPDEWSIRQIIHHFAESSSLILIPVKIALAQSGSACAQSYSQDQWVEGLDYAHRPIEASLALVKAVQVHIIQLLHHVPDNWERYVVFVEPSGGEGEGWQRSIGGFIENQVRHTAEHIDEIRQTRQLYNR